MKVSTNQLRQLIKEELEKLSENQKKFGIGVVTEFGKDWTLYITLIDLDKLATLFGETPADTFFRNLDKQSIEKLKKQAIVGSVACTSRKNFHTVVGQRSGHCYYAYEIRTMLAQGYAKELWNCLLGATKRHDIYVTIDRTNVTPEAFSWWKKGVQSTAGMKTYPPKGKGLGGHEFLGQFDDVANPKTPPKIDDCPLWPDHPTANKAYQGVDQNLKFLEKLEGNMNSFFDIFIREKLQKPGFFTRWLESNPEKARDKQFMKKMTKKLIRHAQNKFEEWYGQYKSTTK